MKTISASNAKQQFGSLLIEAAHAPIGIERHGKVIAVLSPGLIRREEAISSPREAARAAQRAVEESRLLRHHKVALALALATPSQAQAMITAAMAEVAKWEEKKACGSVYIEKWKEILSRDVRQISGLIVSELDGWGNALRQNSPWKFVELCS